MRSESQGDGKVKITVREKGMIEIEITKKLYYWKDTI